MYGGEDEVVVVIPGMWWSDDTAIREMMSRARNRLFILSDKR